MVSEEMKAKKEKRKKKRRDDEDKNNKEMPKAAEEKMSKAKKKETHEAAMVKTGVEVMPMVYLRMAKDRKISFNPKTKDFIEHLENPAPGSLTGGQLPYTHLTMIRGHRRTLMNRVMACGPTNDPILHRGLPLVNKDLLISDYNKIV